MSKHFKILQRCRQPQSPRHFLALLQAEELLTRSAAELHAHALKIDDLDVFALTDRAEAMGIPEEDVVAALAKNGFKVDRSHLTSQNFYFSLLLEATATA